MLVLALIAFGQALNFVWTLLALCLHEAGHAAMARLRGYAVKSVVLQPYGAMMSLDESFDRTSAVLIGAAGPAVNAALAGCVAGLWWILPAAYPFTAPFFYANLSLCLFNLLPVYPLDGSRIVLGLCKNKLRAIRGMQIAGVAVSLALFALCICSFFFDFNPTLGIIAVFLFHGAAIGTREEMYVSVLDSSSKNYALGVEQKRVRISADAPIIRLFHHVSSSSETVFEVLEDDKKLCELSETALKDIALSTRLSSPIGPAVKGEIKTAEKRGRRADRAAKGEIKTADKRRAERSAATKGSETAGEPRGFEKRIKKAAAR